MAYQDGFQVPDIEDDMDVRVFSSPFEVGSHTSTILYLVWGSVRASFLLFLFLGLLNSSPSFSPSFASLMAIQFSSLFMRDGRERKIPRYLRCYPTYALQPGHIFVGGFLSTKREELFESISLHTCKKRGITFMKGANPKR